MSVKVIVPQLGQSIAEATILKWLKQPGDRVEKGETLVEIGTDKINTELPAPESGIIESLLVPEGETVPIETVIALLNSGDGQQPAAADAVSRPAVRQQITLPADSADRRRYSPYVRKLAREHQLDLALVKGTGASGRVTKEDVLRMVQRKPARKAPVEGGDRIPMSRMRKLIAEHMSLSRRTAADVSTFFEVDMTEVSRIRERVKEAFFTKNGVKLTFLPFIVEAVVKALREFPVLNSSIDGEEMVFHREMNIGVAVALDDGLLVPVIRNAEEKNLIGLARSMQDLSDRARGGRLSPDELQGGTFTITNPGVFGALMGTPIIHQPQVAILGVGAVVKRPVVINDAIAIRSMTYLSLSYDHRALDGATADRFLAHIKNTLETQSAGPELS